MSFTTQPAPYQIANYNIFPSTVVAIDRVLPSNQTLFLTLVDSNTREVVKGGFVSGDVRVIRAGSQKVRLSGLKLNKMGPIKHELQVCRLRNLVCSL